MAKIKYPVRLTEEEVERAKAVVSAGRAGARTIRRANILLMLDENRKPGVKQSKVASLLGVSELTMRKVAMQYCEEGLDSTLTPKRNETQHPPVKLDGAVQAHITAIACSTPPEGHSGWTLQMIRDRVIELRVVDSVSIEGIRKVLKKRITAPSE
jgi:transposase